MASTAESISFANGASFSAVSPTAAPLLTVSAPIGLQFGDRDTGITLQTLDPSTRVAKGCDTSQDNQFIASGRGGLPISPTSYLVEGNLWADLRPVVAGLAGQNNREQHDLEPRSLVEASSWQQDSQGQVVLISHSGDAETISTPTAANCLAATD